MGKPVGRPSPDAVLMDEVTRQKPPPGWLIAPVNPVVAALRTVILPMPR